MAEQTPLSLIDFATIYSGEKPREAIARSVELAQRAEELGFARVWYAEHHNMASIMSSAPAVLIAHVGAHTSRIRLGAGGVMLPNHSPYVIAEQFGMLAEMYPDRIDLGLGRAPGTDMNTLGRALRRDPMAADRFPDDVKELAGFLSHTSPIPGVTAVPGQHTQVPLYILGSSLFGANLAAELGLPFAFASHFAPTNLFDAAKLYRHNFRPSARHSEPYFVAAVNVTAADDQAQAREDDIQVKRRRLRHMVTRNGASITEDQLDAIMDSPQGRQMLGMLKYTAVGTGEQVRDYLTDFRDKTRADELMISFQSPTGDAATHSMELLANSWGLEETKA